MDASENSAMFAQLELQDNAFSGWILLLGAVIAGIMLCYVIYIPLEQYINAVKHPHIFPKEQFPLEHTYRALQTREAPLKLMLEWTMKWAHPTFSFHLLGQPRYYVTYDPKNLQHVLKDEFEKFGKGPIFRRRAIGLLGNGIFNVDGHEWYVHRKVSANLFNVRKFKTTIFSTFLEHCDILEHILKLSPKGTVHDMHDWFHRFTLDSIGKIAFGTKIGSLEDPTVTFAKSFDYIQAQVADSFLDPIWLARRYLMPAGWMYHWHLYKMNKYAYEMVRRRREDPEIEGKGDLLSLFLSRSETVAKDVDLTDEYLRDVVINFIIAGRDTTAQALSWSFYVMSTMPEFQKAVRDEVRSITDPLPEGEKFTYESINKMKYTEAFVMEVLRLYPSVPKELKYAFEESTLPDGTHIPKGGCVAFFPFVMGRHPALWENPEMFDPTRFLDKPKPSPYKFIAFQAGPRICLGQSLALLEAKSVIARLVQSFEFQLAVPKEQITYKNSLTFPMKNGLPMIVTPLS